MRPAVFLDRDGTLIEEVNFLVDPGDVRLVCGGGQAVAELSAAGFAVVIVTNQSAIGRGLLTEAGLALVHDELEKQLAAHNATLDGIYHCPIAPTIESREVIEHPDRKPGPGMLLRAAADLDIDLSQSWIVGDALRDVLAGRNAGVRATVLVRTGLGSSVDEGHPAIDHVVNDFPAAMRLILGQSTKP